MRYFLYFFLLSVFAVRYFFQHPVYKDGDRVRITARVLQEPARYSSRQRIILSGLKIYLPLYPEIVYGDMAVVEGVVEKGELKNPLLVKTERKKSLLFSVRQKILSFYLKNLPEPHFSLVAGVVLGSKSSLPESFWNSLKVTGTAHVVVASGMNVTMVAGFLTRVLSLFLKRRKSVLFVIPGIFAYAALSGFDAPIVRAAVMGTIAFAAQLTGRLSTAWRALVLSALLMLAVKPVWIEDLGFILSFVATASLLVFTPGVGRIFKFVPSVLKEGLVTSVSAQIGVAPILFATFGQFSLISPLVNALVLWTIGYIMIFGAMGALLGFVFEPLGRAVLLLAYPLSGWFVFIVEFFGKGG